MTGLYHGCHVKLFDYSHVAAPDYYAEHRHTLILLHRNAQATDSATEGAMQEEQLPNFAITPGGYLERYLVEYQEVDLVSRPALAPHFRLYAQDPTRTLAFIGPKFEQLLSDHPYFYVEIRDNVMLVFRPSREFESPEAIEMLLAFTELMTGGSCERRSTQ